MPDPSPVVLLFDVDGVLTDEYARPDNAAIREVARQRQDGAGVALITGRSRGWLSDHILPSLRSSLTGDQATTIPVACETGAVLGDAGAAGSWDYPGPRLPPGLIEDLRRLATKYDPFIEWDASKECIATVEVRHDVAISVGWQVTRDVLEDYLRAAEPLAAAHGCLTRLASYAVDVVPQGLSKRSGARAVLSRLVDDGRLVQVLAFGDSPSDLEMAQEAVETRPSRVRFVWLGGSTAPVMPDGIELVVPSLPYASGTVEVLRSFLQ